MGDEASAFLPALFTSTRYVSSLHLGKYRSMSLFKTRDLWSLELNQLHQDGQNSIDAADFVASTGRFSATGEDKDTLVVGNLLGFMYIVQIPELSLESRNVCSNESSSKQRPSFDSPAMDGRQLLAAKKLTEPIVDLRCGFFSSAIRQSIAVLTFDRLILYQVRRRRVDLLSAELNTSSLDEGPMLLDEGLLSHEFDEYHSISLMPRELAQHLLILDSHADSSLNKSNNAGEPTAATVESNPTGSDNRQKEANTNGRKFLQKSKQIVEQLHLPQRDKLIVQYANQFVFTLIEGKKVTGHFELKTDDHQDQSPGAETLAGGDDFSEIKQQQRMQIYDSSRSVDYMPMAYLESKDNNNQTKSAYLVVSLSNYKLYCLPLSKLNLQAKQEIVKRVALNLLHSESNTSTKNSTSAIAPVKGAVGQSETIGIDLSSSSTIEWTMEMSGLPLQMIGVQRLAHDSTLSLYSSTNRESGEGQLIVMSRYQVNLISSSGQRIWSQSFETPLVCLAAHTVEVLNQAENVPLVVTEKGMKDERQSPLSHLQQADRQRRFMDELVILICSDCLSDDKSSLSVFKNERLVWSALLNSKPLQMWRINLSHISGLLATLDVRQGQLTVSYLGTNLEIADDELLAQDSLDPQQNSPDDQCFAELERLGDDPFFRWSKDACEQEQSGTLDSELFLDRKNLQVVIELEAMHVWPNVAVSCSIDIYPAPGSSRVLHNIVATLEFDDLLNFELQSERQEQESACRTFSDGGIVRLRLGSCWPDSREPIKIRSTFSLSSSSTLGFKGVEAIDKLDQVNECRTSNLARSGASSLVPKSLSVSMLLEYNDTHSGVMVQEELFLLPITMLANLAHLDYTTGQGQNLSDVLGNLGNLYADGPNDVRQPNGNSRRNFCDLLINIDCDFVRLLDQLIERDLICRGQVSPANSFKDADDDRKRITMENINLLAQSLDCRLRYRSPSGFVRQSSDEGEHLAPVMFNLALKFPNGYSNVLNQLTSPTATEPNTEVKEDVVWIQICQVLPSEDQIALSEELLSSHRQKHVIYPDDDCHLNCPNLLTPQSSQKTQIILSIECQNSLPVVFFQQHMIHRLQSCIAPGLGVTLRQMSTKTSNHTYGDLCRELKKGINFQLVSLSINDSLCSLYKLVESSLRTRFGNLRDELNQELVKFHLTISASLSLAKRLPALSEGMAEQLNAVVILTRQYQKNLIKLVNELERLKRLDYELSKLPSSNNVWLKFKDQNAVLKGFELKHVID